MNHQRKNSPLRRWQGPLTRDLVLHPGEFGLGQVPARLKPDGTTSVVCGFCSTGCSLRVHLKDGEAINLSPDSNYPVNLGMACPKGWEALAPLDAPDRGTTPLLRQADGSFRPVDWHTAMTEFSSRLKNIQARHGPESIAFLGTGQICTEEMALLGCLFKCGMGGIHCDSNTRQCMATAHVAYKESFGFDAPPFTYADFEESDVLVFIGSNPCIAHPIMWQRVMRNSNRPEIVVIDPRKTETAMAATRHLAILPKSDLVLLYGLANIIIASGWIDRDFIANHTRGFEEFAEFVTRFTSDEVSAATGLPVEEIWELANTIHRGRRVSFWWTMGVNQGHEATRTAQAIINLALMTGNLGRPGTGANSITGQCNAMGSRLFANITSLIGGHDAANPTHRAKISDILGITEDCIPSQPSLAYDQILEKVRAGSIKGLWIIATNTSHSWINKSEVREILSKLEFLVVQDMYPTTETAQFAHLYLPAAGWGEKEGTFINSERRFGLVKKVRRAPGLALSDFNIFKLIAQYWGCGDLFSRWSSPEAVFQILKEISRGQPCDITGIHDYAMLDQCGGIQWPWPARPTEDGDSPAALTMREKSLKRLGTASIDSTGLMPGVNEISASSSEVSGAIPAPERRLFEDGKFYHLDGKARFLFEAPRPLPESTSAEFPFFLLTGRGTSAQWHTGTRTDKSDVLRSLSPATCYVELNTRDASRLRITAGSNVEIRSRLGAISATALLTPTVQPGQVFIPMHYPEVNRLICAAFDPYSRQPAYKSGAVQVSLIKSSAQKSPPKIRRQPAVAAV